MNPYEILNVAPTASAAEIKQRYRETVKSCHPDLGNEPERVERFKQVNDAYHLLMDPIKRNEYNRENQVSDSGQGWGADPATAAEQAEEQKRNQQADNAAHAHELLAQGRAQVAAGEFQKAEDSGRFMLRWRRNDADAYTLIAQAMLGQGRIAEARGCLSLALHNDPTHPQANQILRALLEQTDEKAA